MAIRRSAPTGLDDRMRRLLLLGPWAVGLDLATMPSHALLRATWREHEQTLRAAAEGFGIQPWFPDRDYFVRLIDGEDVCRSGHDG